MRAVWDWLFTPPTLGNVLNPLSGLYLIVFLAGFVVSAYRLRDEIGTAPAHGAMADQSRRCARDGLVICGAGLVFFAVRTLQINPLLLAAPIWMILALLALLFAGWRCVAERHPD